MTLDDFLRAFESLVDERETSDDDPGVGNYGCEDCRACNNCRFCIGCDSCEDCTYCEECLECTSCTQSKRCVDCKKVSYCEDSRDCKGSRYLTLCVECSDCVHCLACVGLEGAEFFVLNQKRSRKEYFALLRQMQELMQERMNGGWRPPGIGLASDIFDPALAGRDSELSAAPWLEELLAGRAKTPPHDPEYDDHRPVAELRGRELLDDPAPVDDYRPPVDDYRPEPGRQPSARAPDRDYERPPPRAPERDYARPPARASERDYPRAPESDRGYGRLPTRPERPESDPSRRSRSGTDTYRLDEPPARSRPVSEPERDWISEPPAFGTSYDERPDERTIRRTSRHVHPDYGDDLGRALDPDDDWERGLEPEGRYPAEGRYPERGDYPRRPYPGEDSQAQTSANVPAGRQEQPTQPFNRAAAREGRRDPGRGHAPSHVEDRGYDDSAPAPRQREPSSPWIDEAPTQARRKAKRGSLRRAGRPKRPSERSGEGTGTGTGTGSGSFRTGTGEGTHTGLRMGRKPKKKR